MNRSTLSFFSLSALVNLAASLGCPSVGTTCIYQGDIAYVFGNKNTPDCWEQNGSGYKCFRKLEGGKCPREGLTTDVSSCPGFVTKPTKLVCPQAGDLCIYQGDIGYVFGNQKAPECWTKVNSSYKCERKSPSGTCKQDELTQDASLCPGFTPKPTKPDCPAVGTMCLYQGDIAYIFGNQSTPECWEKNGNGHKCYRKSENGNCAREEATRDVSSCPGYVIKQ